MTMPPSAGVDAAHIAALERTLAARYAITDIETHAEQIRGADGSIWWDTSAMLDPREGPPEFIDMAQQLLTYALAVGIAVAHPTREGLVRITAEPDLWPQGH